MRVHVSTAAYGDLPPLVNTGLTSLLHDISFSSYNDQNTPSRSLAMRPRLKGKIPKMLAHRQHDADWYFWIDSKFHVRNPAMIDIFMEHAESCDLMVFPHYQRHSIGEELSYMTQLMAKESRYLGERYRGEPISEQVASYLTSPGFVDDKLYAMGFFGYNRSAIPLMEEWFMHQCLWSVQDQLSFPYLLSLHKELRVKCLQYDLLNNVHFIHSAKIKRPKPIRQFFKKWLGIAPKSPP